MLVNPMLIKGHTTQLISEPFTIINTRPLIAAARELIRAFCNPLRRDTSVRLATQMG